MYAVYANVDGSLGMVALPASPLKTLQSLVGGFVEFVTVEVPVLGEIDLIVNEEGKLHGLEKNPVTRLFAPQLFQGDYLAGDIAFTKGTSDEGDTLGFTRDEAVDLINVLSV